MGKARLRYFSPKFFIFTCIASIFHFPGCRHESASTAGNTPGAGSASVVLPLGAPVSGVTLSGPLAGKTMYLLPSSVNPAKCWKDSAAWNGSELLYGLSSISWTKLFATNAAYVADPQCTLPGNHLGIDFNVYSAKPVGGSWTLQNLAFNSGAHPFAAAKISGNLLAFVSFEKAPSSWGNIYLVNRTGANSWGPVTLFPQSSASCNDDNPVLLANGTKIIFESNRADSAATSCIANHQQLWISTFSSGAWSAPVPLVGAPALQPQSYHPWVDENSGILYWTADSASCGGGVINCVMQAAPQGADWSNTAQKIITPTPLTAGVANGKVVMVGQFTQANGYAIAACAIATETDPTGSTPTLFANRWTIVVNICAIPL